MSLPLPVARRPADEHSGEPPCGNYFVSTYPPFSRWSEAGTGDFVRRLARPLDRRVPLGLYVHVPFCEKRCDYCYYLSHSGPSLAQIDAYLAALGKELRLLSRAPALAGRKPDFVYFGGGTPSLLSAPRIRSLVAEIQKSWPWDGVEEVTFECAPRTVTYNRMRELRDAGVTRISLGVQQFDDAVLRKNGRIHRVRDVERAYEWVRRVGFPVINLDLMVGLLGETAQSFGSSVERVTEMRPQSVTIYQLEIPYNTPLYRSMQSGSLPAQPWPWTEKRRRLAGGFDRLEEVGYTLRSAYSAVLDPLRHRFVYQEDQYHGADLVGVGAASFSYLDGVHHQNLASLKGYMRSLAEDRLPLGRAYTLSHNERLVRELVLQLKLGRCDAAYFRSKFGVEIAQRFAEALAAHAERGWLKVDEQGVELTRSGLLRVDRLLPSFYLAEHRGVRYS